MRTPLFVIKLVLIVLLVSIPFGVLSFMMREEVNQLMVWSLWAFAAPCFIVATLWARSSGVAKPRVDGRSPHQRLMDSYRTCIAAEEDSERRIRLFHIMDEVKKEASHGRHADSEFRSGEVQGERE